MTLNKVLPREDLEALHSLIVKFVDPRKSWETLSLKAVFLTIAKGVSVPNMSSKLQELLEAMEFLIKKNTFCNYNHFSRVIMLFISKRFQLDEGTFRTIFNLQKKLLSTSSRAQPVQWITLQAFAEILHPSFPLTSEDSKLLEASVLQALPTLTWADQVRGLWGIMATKGASKPVPRVDMTLEQWVSWARTETAELRSATESYRYSDRITLDNTSKQCSNRSHNSLETALELLGSPNKRSRLWN